MLRLCDGRVGLKTTGGISLLKFRNAALLLSALFQYLGVLHARIAQNRSLMTNQLTLVKVFTESLNFRELVNQVKIEGLLPSVAIVVESQRYR